MTDTDVVIIGAGVIGLAIGRQLAMAGQSVYILEQQDRMGTGISSRNSGVIHAGLYYPQNSLKARLCVAGKAKLYDYCKQHEIPHKRIGKVIVACNDAEQQQLKNLIRSAGNNGVRDLCWWDKAMLAHYEPALQAEAAVFSPSTGIVDVPALMLSLLAAAEHHGATFIPQSTVTSIAPLQDEPGFRLQVQDTLSRTAVTCRQVINCAGLGAQTVAASIEGLPAEAIPPLHLCKGTYFTLSGKSPFKHLIYPVPEANHTGLGIHATLDLGGQVRFGPDVEYVTRETYQPDLGRYGSFVTAIQRYYPKLDTSKLSIDSCGIRPKLQGPGEPTTDFVIQNGADYALPGLINLFGIESPGITACLAIAEYVQEQLANSL